MKHFRSEHAFEKYKPHVSWRKKLARFFRKKQQGLQAVPEPSHYRSHPFRSAAKPSSAKIKVILFFTLLAFWIACLAYIPYFKINKIEYSGLNNTSKKELDEFINQQFLNKKSRLPLNNYFFISADKISKNLDNTFSFDTVEVNKVFPDKLEINVREKTSSVIYDNGQKYFLLDSGGTVIKYLADVEARETTKKTISTIPDLSLVTSSTTSTLMMINTSTYEHTPNNEKINKLFGQYPIIYDRRGISTEIKQTNVLPADYISAVLSWYKYLNEQGRMSPKFFILDDLNSGIAIDTNLSWNIIFQPKKDTATQLTTFKEILPSIKPKDYVDLRFGEKVYWK
jgi:cell division septal protein FtsQ